MFKGLGTELKKLWQDDEGEARAKQALAFDRAISLEQNDCLEGGMSPLALPITAGVRSFLTGLHEKDAMITGWKLAEEELYIRIVLPPQKKIRPNVQLEITIDLQGDVTDRKEVPLDALVTESGDTKNGTSYAVCKVEVEKDAEKYLQVLYKNSLPKDLYAKLRKNANFFLSRNKYSFDLPELNLRRIVIMHLVTAAIGLPISRVLQQSHGPEVCNMMAEGRPLQDGSYKYFTPHFNPRTRTPARMIEECRSEFETVVPPEMAQKSYEATFKDKKAK